MRYDRLVEDALRMVVRSALKRVESDGLPGGHHFYITFLTHFVGVIMPDYLREQYETDITIVLKSHFWELEVEDHQFSVGLSFKQKPERLTIPFASITRFVDPEVEFDLRFHPEPPIPQNGAPDGERSLEALPETKDGEAEVVSLDAFRKK